MSKKCPPGVICIENMTLLFIIVAICTFLLIIQYVKPVAPSQQNEQTEMSLNLYPPLNTYLSSVFTRPNLGYTRDTGDVLLNPYTAPLRDDRYITGSGDPRGIPINIQTQGVDAAYRQTGILTRINGPETILPLMGRPLITNRDKWQFYTMSDKNQAVKLPVSKNGRSCTNEYGCDNLYDGDTVYIEGYNDAFKVTNYDNNVMKYIPFI